MPSLLQIIKKAAVDAVEASNPMRMIQGTVVSTNPMQIKIDQKLTITDDFIIPTVRMENIELVEADTVILLREQGGQNFLVLDKTKAGEVT